VRRPFEINHAAKLFIWKYGFHSIHGSPIVSLDAVAYQMLPFFRWLMISSLSMAVKRVCTESGVQNVYPGKTGQTNKVPMAISRKRYHNATIQALEGSELLVLRSNRKCCSATSAWSAERPLAIWQIEWPFPNSITFILNYDRPLRGFGKLLFGTQRRSRTEL
jgi:hypothetical protein